jgi:hypothetical protein
VSDSEAISSPLYKGRKQEGSFLFCLPPPYKLAGKLPIFKAYIYLFFLNHLLVLPLCFPNNRLLSLLNIKYQIQTSLASE